MSTTCPDHPMGCRCLTPRPPAGPYQARGGANDGATIEDLLPPTFDKDPADCDHALKTQVGYIADPDGGSVTLTRCINCGERFSWHEPPPAAAAPAAELSVAPDPFVCPRTGLRGIVHRVFQWAAKQS